MSKYYIKRFYRTSISLSKDRKEQQEKLGTWKFKYPADNVSVAAKDSIERVDDLSFHYGLDVIVEVEAKNDEEAISISMAYSEVTINMMTFTSLAICHPPKLINSIKFEYELNKSQFRENIYPLDLSEMIIELSPLDKEKFNQVYEAYNRCEPQFKERVIRATSWLRKGMAERHTMDKFISFWIGIEAVKNILRKKLKKTNDEWKGVKNVFSKRLEGINFEKIKDARQCLFHGYGELSPDFHKEVASYIDSVMLGLIWSIAEILKIDDEIVDKAINDANWKKTLNVWHVLGGSIHGLKGSLEEDIKNFPKIKMTGNNTKYSFNNDGTIAAKLNPSFTPVSDSKEIKWKVNFVEIRGE